jgi:hypothetical protein
VQPFYRDRGTAKHSLYHSRNRLREGPAVRFMVIETKMASAKMRRLWEPG